MGKFLNFFKNIGQGIKRGATKVVDFVKNKAAPAIGRIVRPAIDIASKVGGFMSVLPGKFGKYGELFHKGADAVREITNLLPNSQAKDKINDAVNTIDDGGGSLINKAQQGIERFNNITQPWLNSGINIARRIGDYSNRFGH